MKKKVLLGLLVVVCLFSIVGCGKSKNNEVKVTEKKEKRRREIDTNL